VTSDSPFNFGGGGGPFGGAGGGGRKKAGFMQQAGDDPLADVPVTGNVETDAAAELDALAKGFRERRDQEEKRFRDATDSEYWFAVCFRSRADKDAFLAAVGAVQRLGDKYIDGYALAKQLGIAPDFEG
jgi:hypothetical protein